MEGNRTTGVVCPKHLEQKLAHALSQAVGPVNVGICMKPADCGYCGDVAEYVVTWTAPETSRKE